MPEPTKIVLVGHCGADCYALRSAIGAAIPGASVEFINDEAAALASRADLLLVNRALDGDFESEDGIALIRRLQGKRAMLISNYSDAQANAEQAGALPGFGKKHMYAEDTKTRLQNAVNLAH